MKKLITLVTALSMVSSIAAENIAIVGGKVHTMTSAGVLDKGTVLLSDGRISAVLLMVKCHKVIRLLMQAAR